MRLIDADALIEEIKSLQVFVTGLRAGKGVLNEYAKQYRESLLRIVDEQPTAYSVEKVAGEIEDVLWNCYIDNGQGFKTYVNRACEILRKGGKE